jgi:hypothetical protein
MKLLHQPILIVLSVIASFPASAAPQLPNIPQSDPDRCPNWNEQINGDENDDGDTEGYETPQDAIDSAEEALADKRIVCYYIIQDPDAAGFYIIRVRTSPV